MPHWKEMNEWVRCDTICYIVFFASHTHSIVPHTMSMWIYIIISARFYIVSIIQMRNREHACVCVSLCVCDCCWLVFLRNSYFHILIAYCWYYCYYYFFNFSTIYIEYNMDYDKQYEEDIEKATALSLETLALEQFRRNKSQYSSISDVATTTSILKSTCKWNGIYYLNLYHILFIVFISISCSTQLNSMWSFSFVATHTQHIIHWQHNDPVPVPMATQQPRSQQIVYQIQWAMDRWHHHHAFRHATPELEIIVMNRI